MEIGIDRSEMAVDRAGLEPGIPHTYYKVPEIIVRGLLQSQPCEALSVPFNCFWSDVL
jgi:hypothetical protein